MDIVRCPRCLVDIQSDPSLAGRQFQCPRCTQVLIMPIGLQVAQVVSPTYLSSKSSAARNRSSRGKSSTNVAIGGLLGVCLILLVTIGVVLSKPRPTKLNARPVAIAIRDEVEAKEQKYELERADGLLLFAAAAEKQPIRQNRELLFVAAELFRRDYTINGNRVPNFNGEDFDAATNGYNTLDKQIGSLHISWKVRWDDGETERLPWSLTVTPKNGYERKAIEQMSEEWRVMGARLPEGVFRETVLMSSIAQLYLEHDLRNYGDLPGDVAHTGIRIKSYSNGVLDYLLILEKQVGQDRFELTCCASRGTRVTAETFDITMRWYPPARSIRR